MYRCRKCGETQSERKRVNLTFTPHAHCPQCGNQRLKRLAARDRIDRMHGRLFNRLQGLLGASLYHCFWCRLQFYDYRSLAPEPAANAAVSAVPGSSGSHGAAQPGIEGS